MYYSNPRNFYDVIDGLFKFDSNIGRLVLISDDWLDDRSFDIGSRELPILAVVIPRIKGRRGRQAGGLALWESRQV